MKKSIFLIFVTAILCFALTACAAQNNPSSSSAQNGTSSFQNDVIDEPQSSTPATSSESISVDEAKSIALQHANLTADKIAAYEIELDNDDAVKHYEIEFKSGGYEYKYDINAESGKILKSEKEFHD